MTTKEFLKLPKKVRAVLIAKDVLKQLKLGTYVPRNDYTTCPTKKSVYNKLDENSDAAEFLRNPKSPVHCEGCARASLFISAVKFKNELTLEDVTQADFDYPGDYSWSNEKGGTGTEYLSDEFTPYQQAIIESAFENSESFGEELESKMSDTQVAKFNKERKAAVEFHKKEVAKWKAKKGQEGRPSKNNWVLQAIVKNIIKNEGVFKP